MGGASPACLAPSRGQPTWHAHREGRWPMDIERGPGSLVVVGASAGGIEALSTLLSAVPADFPAPIVVAQHLDPTRISALGAILARESKLPVRTVEEQEPLAPGVVFVAPANRHVEISDHMVQVYVGGSDRPKPS